MELGVWKRKDEEVGRERKKFKSFQKPNLMKILYYAAVVIIARTKLFGEMMPFGAAAFAVDYIGRPSYITGAIAVLVTLFPEANPLYTIKYTAAMVLFTALSSRFGEHLTKTIVHKAALMGGSVLVSGIFMLVGTDILFYDIFMLILEAIIVFASVYLFSGGKKSLFLGGGDLSEDVVSMAALLGVAVLGIGNTINFYGVDITFTLCVLVTLLLSCNNGITGGAVTGITLGTIATLKSGNPVLGAFALAGMAAGYFSKFGKAAAALAFVCANSIIMFYTGGTNEMVVSIYEVLSASLIFIAIPKKLSGMVAKRDRQSRGYAVRLRDYMIAQLENISGAFSDVGKMFTAISEDKLYGTNEAASAFFERTARKTCEGCSMLKFCWKKEFHRTYTSFFVMLEMCGKKGVVTEEDIPKSLAEKCMKKSRLVQVFNNTYDVYRIDKLWENRVSESRKMVAKQLEGMSKCLKDMTKEFRTGLSFNYDAEDLIASVLNEKQLFVKSITVVERQKSGTSVDITFKEDISPDKKQIEEIVSKYLNEDMCIIKEKEDGFCLTSSRKYKIELGKSLWAKEDSAISGDNCDGVYMDNGKFVLAVSDGMGSGERAGRDSKATIEMLKKLLKAGFDFETAIGIVNSVLVLKSAESTFATIDMAILNTKKSEAEFIKIGAAASYIKHGDAVKCIKAETLPAGVLEKPDVGKMKIKFSDGDMIVMVSDGITEADRKTRDEKWITELISEYNGTNPQELTERIINAAKDKSAGIVNDDMTVLAAYIKENKMTA